MPQVILTQEEYNSFIENKQKLKQLRENYNKADIHKYLTENPNIVVELKIENYVDFTGLKGWDFKFYNPEHQRIPKDWLYDFISYFNLNIKKLQHDLKDREFSMNKNAQEYIKTLSFIEKIKLFLN